MKRGIVVALTLLIILVCAGCSCEHQYGEWITTTNASCNTEGEQVRICAKCKETETRGIAATTHSFGEWEVTKIASCTAAGIETSSCQNCSEAKTRETAMIDHAFGEWKPVQASTCSVAGKDGRICVYCGFLEEKEAALAEHVYGEFTVVQAATCTAAGTASKTCRDCGHSETKSVDPSHTWKNATCVAPKTCTNCGETQGAKTNHTWKAATSVKPKQCSTCGATEGSALGVQIKDMSNTYLFYNSNITIIDNNDGTINFRIECLKGANSKTGYVKMVGYDSAGNQTFTSVEPTYYVNTVYSYLQHKAVPADTVMIHLTDHY